MRTAGFIRNRELLIIRKRIDFRPSQDLLIQWRSDTSLNLLNKLPLLPRYFSLLLSVDIMTGYYSGVVCMLYSTVCCIIILHMGCFSGL